MKKFVRCGLSGLIGVIVVSILMVGFYLAKACGEALGQIITMALR